MGKIIEQRSSSNSIKETEVRIINAKEIPKIEKKEGEVIKLSNKNINPFNINIKALWEDKPITTFNNNIIRFNNKSS